MQNRYNLVDRNSEDVLEYCTRENIGFIPWFPLATGELAKRDGPLTRAAKRQRSAVILAISSCASCCWQQIRVGRDFGTQLEVLDSLAENTKVVMNRNDDLVEGVQVQVKSAEKPKADIAATPAPSPAPEVAKK